MCTVRAGVLYRHKIRALPIFNCSFSIYPNSQNHFKINCVFFLHRDETSQEYTFGIRFFTSDQVFHANLNGNGGSITIYNVLVWKWDCHSVK